MSGSLNLSIRVENLDKVREELGKLTGLQTRTAYAKALNDTGHYVRREMGKAFRSAFDRPTPYIVNSPKFVGATPDNLSIRVMPTLSDSNKPSSKGVDQQKILQSQEFGGERRDKRSEVALRRAGILPSGMQTAIPDDGWGGPFPGSDDGNGNLRGQFLVKLLSYLQAFEGKGRRSNVTAKSAVKRKDMEVFSVLATRRQVMTMNGWEFFVSEGKASIKFGRAGAGGGPRKVWEVSRAQNLRAGIWARQGKQLRPVLMFVRAARYTPRISMERIAAQADVQAYLDKRVRFRIREAAGV